ncbi:MAG: glycosyltransferase [Gammaproteobacteria bacterium]|nr:glycosyltransferase [Gammaproteobacteria bacterium]
MKKAYYCPTQLWCSPDASHAFFAKCADKYGVSLHVQQGNDLGERMNHAINTALKTSTTVLLVGCDCPSLRISDFESALDVLQLEDNDIVISPAEDGGYVMIGMKNPYPSLFTQMTWGHEHVYLNTLQRIADLGLGFLNLINIGILIHLKIYCDYALARVKFNNNGYVFVFLN